VKGSTLWHVALAALSGACWFLACADFNVWPLAWLAMVPALFVIERVDSTRRAFFFAWITGFVTSVGGFYWIVGLLVRFGHLPWIVSAVVFAGVAAYQGLVCAMFGVITRVIRRRTRLPMAFVAPLVFVTCELAVPMIFPYSMAITQAWRPVVIQVADLAGTPGVAALLLMINGAIYDALLMRPRRFVPALASAGVLSAALSYGHWRIGQVDRLRAAAPHIEVGVVQPNLSFDMKGGNRVAFAARQLRELQEQSRLLDADGVELVVWPETAFPYAISRAADRDVPEGNPRRVRAGFTVPVLFGATSSEGSRSASHARSRVWNTAFLLDREGRFTGRYDKIHRMLFSEYMPGRDRFAFIDRWLPSTTTQYERGDAVATFDFRAADGHAWKLGPLICYEDIREGFGRDLSALHPNLLVNITNDSWFGDTSEPWEHLALSVFGAVESRTDLVRAVNTGVSAFVDAAGRVYARTYAVDPVAHAMGAGRIHARVVMLDGGHTVYAAVGNLFAYLCAALTAVLCLARRQPRRAPDRAIGQL
jgi:apolipoprotein N-acyltransferase